MRRECFGQPFSWSQDVIQSHSQLLWVPSASVLMILDFLHHIFEGYRLLWLEEFGALFNFHPLIEVLLTDFGSHQAVSFLVAVRPHIGCLNTWAILKLILVSTLKESCNYTRIRQVSRLP